jgi:anti-sigma factor RsiW
MTGLPPEPTCRDVAGFLADYLAQELDADERTRFEAHLHACPECVTYLRTYGDTIRLTKDAGLPDPVPEELVRAILATRPRKDTR